MYLSRGSQFSAYVTYFSAADLSCARILEQSMGARKWVGLGLPYRPARLHRLAESIPGLLKSLKIPSPEIDCCLVELHWDGYFSCFTGVKNLQFYDLRLTFVRHFLCRLNLLFISQYRWPNAYGQNNTLSFIRHHERNTKRQGKAWVSPPSSKQCEQNLS